MITTTFRKNLWLFLFISFLSFNYGFPQESDQTEEPTLLYEKAKNLLKTAQYDSAIFYFTKAADLNEISQSWGDYLNCMNKISECNWRNGRLFKGMEIAEHALKINDLQFDEDNIQRANSYMQLGTINNIQGNSETALDYYERSWSLKTELLNEGHIELAFLSNNIGNVHLIQGRYDKAIEFYDQAIAAFKAQDDDVSQYLAHPLFNKGEILKDQGFYNQALKFHEEALALWKSNLVETHPLIGRAYIKIGQIHLRKEAYDLAYEYLTKSFTIYNDAYGEEHPFIGELYNSIGYVLHYKGEHKKALTYLLKALVIEKSIYEDEHLNISNIHENIAEVYASTGLYTKAIEQYEIAMEILQGAGNEKHPVLATYELNLGNLYYDLDSLDKAKATYEHALKLAEEVNGDHHPDLSNGYYGMGAILFKKGETNEALKFVQKALIANSPTFMDQDIFKNPSPEDFLDGPFLLDQLILKTEIFIKLWTSKDDRQYLDAALGCHENVKVLIKRLREGESTLKDKITLNKSLRTFYKQAIKLNLKLFDLEKQSKFFEQAFHYAEQSRSSLISMNLSDNNAKKFSELPNDLLSLEKSLRIDRSFYQSQIQEMSISNDGYDTTAFDHYQKELFATNRRFDSLIRIMETGYPEYYQLKYEIDIMSLSDFQDKLSSNEALIEYFDTDNSYYVFVITKEDFNYHILKKTGELEKDISDLRDILRPETLSKDQSDQYKRYVRAAYNCYQSLLEKPLLALPSIDKLVLITDGMSSYVPFEIFIDQMPDGEAVDYKNLPYILKRFQISYGLTANLLYTAGAESDEIDKQDFLAFAPTYAGDFDEDSTRVSSLGKFRGEVTSLDWNIPEVEGLNNYFEGKAYTGDNAKERLFKEEVKKYRILHLAMHSLVDDEDPMNSRLVFTQDNDSIEDGFLNAFELYNMKISADMVVLSACETGYGKLEKGEGVMSLGRAFYYAGCPSIVMSHWKVNDASTAGLMNDFYKNLSQGQSKSEALRSAQLSYLEQADKVFQHPYYWASFVVIGDDAPIIKSVSFFKSYTFWSVLSVLAILVGFFYFKKR